jgi:hypothetical protein
MLVPEWAKEVRERDRERERESTNRADLVG